MGWLSAGEFASLVAGHSNFESDSDEGVWSGFQLMFRARSMRVGCKEQETNKNKVLRVACVEGLVVVV